MKQETIGSLLAIFLLAMCFVFGCAVHGKFKSTNKADRQWEQFNQCANGNYTDTVCDSCYQLVFKK